MQNYMVQSVSSRPLHLSVVNLPVISMACRISLSCSREDNIYKQLLLSRVLKHINTLCMDLSGLQGQFCSALGSSLVYI